LSLLIQRIKTEKGISLIEVMVAMTIISIVVVGYLSAMTTSSRAAIKADQMDTARTLAQSVMEFLKVQPFTSSYTLPSALFAEDSNAFLDYPGYTIGAVYTDAWRIVPTTPSGRDALIQQITVTILCNGRAVFTLEDCKTRR
jgi:prepilin-type N-terminal cleavage/methylation domain-containing protein